MNETTARTLVMALQKRCQTLEDKLQKQTRAAEALSDELTRSNLKVTKLNSQLTLLNGELITALNEVAELLVGQEETVETIPPTTPDVSEILDKPVKSRKAKSGILV
jgi:uncharacterized coiled-coil protein SlyX